jgi:O-antigen ligase
VAVDGITSRARLRRLIDRIATAGAGLACLGILQFFTSIDIRPWFKLPFLSVNGDLQLIFINGRSGFNRVAGTTDHPIEFSAVLAMILPIALHLAFHADPTRKRSAWVRVALIGGAVPLSVSRTGMLGLAVGGAVLFAAWPARRRWQLILLSPVLAVGLRLLVPGLVGSIGSLFLSIQSDTSFTGRTDDYAIAGRLFSQAPFFGRGWGTVLPDRYVLLDNQLLKTLLEGGLLALVALLALFAVGIGAARGSYHRAPDAETKDLGQSLTATIAIGLVTFVTFDAFAFATVPSTLFLVIGCAGALWRMTIAEHSDSQPHDGQSAVRAGVAVPGSGG